MRADLDAVLARAAEAGEVPGVAAAVGTADGVVYQGAFGLKDLRRPDPMTTDTVAWIASMTKAVTTLALLQLVEQGKVDLDAPAGRYCPEIGAVSVLEDFDEAGQPKLRPPKMPVTVRHLLTHTSGYSYDFASAAIRKYMKATGLPATNSGLKAALGAPLIADPGEKFIYGISTDWAGQIVEAVSGLTLEAYFRRAIFEPLGMDDTMFRLGPGQQARRATVHGVREDGSFAPTDMVVVQEPEFASGGGGLYSTVGDYLTFTRMILAGGRLNGRRIASPATIAALVKDEIPHMSVPGLGLFSPMGPRIADFFPGKPTGWSLAFQLNREATPEGRAPGSMFWGGFANTFYWIDPARGVTGVFVTQIVPFFDPRAVTLFKAFETAVYRAL